jgi:hypothetical protein
MQIIHAAISMKIGVSEHFGYVDYLWFHVPLQTMVFRAPKRTVIINNDIHIL